MSLLTSGQSFLGSLSAGEWIIGIGVLALAHLVLSGIYNVYFHPLSSYPGPRLASLTRLWYVYYCLRGDLIYVVSDQHKRYGPIVRIAPDELSYTHPDSWNEIYGHRPGKPEIMKDQVFYSSMSSGPGSIINADRARHGHLRKQMSHGFSEKALRSQEHVIRQYGDLFVQRLDGLVKEGHATVDIVSWFNFFTFDVMGDLVFGQSFGCLEGSKYHPWVKLIFDSVKVAAWVRCAKYWPMVAPLARRLIPGELQRRRVEQRQMAKEKAAFRKAIPEERDDLISGMLRPDSEVTHLEYQSTVETLIIAGSETTATLMSGATYYLLKNPAKMEKVVDEVRSTFSSADEIDFVSVNKLPYLLACLNETLRVYPPVADGFPRNTGPREEIICGKVVPPRTLVRQSQWATYHSPENFTRPDEFIPERWIGEGKGFEKDRKEALQPFNVGPRNCLGRNLAFVEMRLLMALLLWNFDLELAAVSNDWSKQSAFLLWEKPEMFVKIIPRQKQDV